MFDKWLKLPAHYYLRITALVILTVGICLHNTLMSIGAIWIVANWLIEADFKNYWKKFKSTPSIWMMLGILFFGLFSLMWSDNVNYGLWDIFRKLPFFAIPLALGLGKPIEQKVVIFLLYIFIGLLLLTSGINYYRYHFVLDNPADIRQMSYFISPIRFSVLVVLGIFVCAYLIIKRKGPLLLWLLIIPWLCWYTFKAQMLNGYLLLFILTLYTTIYLVKKNSSSTWKWIISSTFFFAIFFGVWKVSGMINELEAKVEFKLDDLELQTKSGRDYVHVLDSPEYENGYPVWLYVQQEELENEWERRSEIAYHGKDKADQPMFGTIIRYMTSKNMRKDSVGIWSLSEEEIRKIENGMTSINTGFRAKLQEVLYQWEMYQNGGDPNGHSLLQRAEHLKVAWTLVEKNGLFGVGAGDVPVAFENEYVASKSLLIKEYWHRSHNQFLTIWISHGILGLIMLVGMLFIPLFKRKKIDYLHMVVFLTLFVSLFFQDMLETQAGVTIFGLFYAITAYKEDESLSSEIMDSSEEE